MNKTFSLAVELQEKTVSSIKGIYSFFVFIITDVSVLLTLNTKFL